MLYFIVSVPPETFRTFGLVLRYSNYIFCRLLIILLLSYNINLVLLVGHVSSLEAESYCTYGNA